MDKLRINIYIYIYARVNINFHRSGKSILVRDKWKSWYIKISIKAYLYKS